VGPTPFGPNGVSPYFIQIVNPSLFQYNEKQEEDIQVGRKRTTLGLPEDPNYPSDARSDALAFTPMFRGHQNRIFDVVFDPYISHGPGADSLFYCQGNDWNNIAWDGTTTFPIWIEDTATEAEKEAHRSAWYYFMFPDDGFCMRGLKQLYDANMPFADEANPTVREFEVWNDKVLNHFRMLSGLNAATPSQELYIMCQWSRERKQTTLWDTDYPGTFDIAYGPCQGGSNLHCGTTFKPTTIAHQQQRYN